MEPPLASSGPPPARLPFPPAPPLKVMHAMMLSATSASKGVSLGNMVKECFTVGSNYTKEGGWHLQCKFCQKDIATGDCRLQNVLVHLARQHLESISGTVMKEIIKSLATPGKEEKLIPTTARLAFVPSVKRSSSDMS
jgi:hypothetical protein